MFNINDFKKRDKNSRYERRLSALSSDAIDPIYIKQAVDNSIQNLEEDVKSFVIYGEPQSGKTELMIALTAKLLDKGYRIVVILLNDSVQLLDQNLDRFKRSGMDPAPKKFNEILDPNVKIDKGEWVIFSKKNAQDLRKLINKIGKFDKKVIIDDEADYATPNSKINKDEITKINELTGALIGKDGVYIGVTATPARLDLNNTHQNENQKWIDFHPHTFYIGQDVFFPTPAEGLKYSLNLLSDEGDDPKYLRDAIFSFITNIAHLNLKINDKEKNYSILIHTSGIKAEHKEDYEEVVKIFEALKDEGDKNHSKYYEAIYNLSRGRYPGEEKEITQYIVDNNRRNTIIVMNSDREQNFSDNTSATNPSTLFTVVIGGNIVSRGVTFENLLSMFFTRDVKHKIQQDTYIQRARMFGTRGEYLEYFELSIPKKLFLDWHKCFIFHRLSLESRRAGNGIPVWLEDQRIAAASSSSIDKTTVSVDRGEMSFEIFDHNQDVENLIQEKSGNFSKLQNLASLIGDSKLPKYLLDYIKNFNPAGDNSIAFHNTVSISGYKDADQEQIKRARGLIGTTELEKEKFPSAIHHFKIFKNSDNKARVFYKYEGNIKFIKSSKKK